MPNGLSRQRFLHGGTNPEILRVEKVADVPSRSAARSLSRGRETLEEAEVSGSAGLRGNMSRCTGSPVPGWSVIREGRKGRGVQTCNHSPRSLGRIHRSATNVKDPRVIGEGNVRSPQQSSSGEQGDPKGGRSPQGATNGGAVIFAKGGRSHDLRDPNFNEKQCNEQTAGGQPITMTANQQQKKATGGRHEISTNQGDSLECDQDPKNQLRDGVRNR